MRNIFGGRETSPRPFSKKSKLRISLDQQSETLIVCPSRDYEGADHFLLPCIKLFLKNKRGLGLVFLTHFPLDF